MAYIDRNGVKVYYEEHGSGPVVLLSHGYAATSHMWHGQVDFFKDRYKVIVWDMRGHGRSDSPTDPSQYSEEATVEDMAAILKECGAAKAVIGGLSLGGYMSLAFNIYHPEIVEALMLFDTGPGYRSSQAREQWSQWAFKVARNYEERGLAALGGGAEVRLARHTSASGLALAARGMLAQFNSCAIDSLGSITVPTLVLVGANDQAYLNATEYMAAKIPGSTRVTIDSAGHASNIDQPAAFNQAMQSFLDDLRL
ncbi:MAG: alpha/beta fold hydrolase [Dehalococcoidia bacterium]|nr:alpha/beta fold hydrolase [Dehalococcoidia bacterium]